MAMTRRFALKGAMLASAAACARVGHAVPDGRAALIVYDSDHGMCMMPGGVAERAIDVARERANQWRSLRASQPAGRVIGLTTWSDFVQAHDCLRDQGLRLSAWAQSGRLFHWEMS
jgi:hypothetical protein